MQTPWLEQLVKQADKSPVYSVKIEFNRLPVLFMLNNEELLTVKSLVVLVIVVRSKKNSLKLL